MTLNSGTCFLSLIIVSRNVMFASSPCCFVVIYFANKYYLDRCSTVDRQEAIIEIVPDQNS